MLQMASVIDIDENKFQVIVSNGYKANGKKKRKKQTFELDSSLTKAQKKKAKEKIIKDFEEKVKDEYYLKNDMRFIDFTKIYMEDYAKEELSITTCKRYETLLVKINEEIGELKLSQIKPPHIKEFKKKIAKFTKKVPIKDEKGKTIGHKEEIIAPKTQLHYFNLVSGILTYAMQEDYITENPCSKVPAPKAVKKETEYLDVETIKQMLKLLENEPIQNRTFIELLLYTGARRGEALALTWRRCSIRRRKNS